MKLYNSLTRKVEDFKPLKPPNVGMYTCGPTVFDHTHLGHMRSYVNTDILRATLEWNGFQVKQVMNVTDVGHLFGDQDMGEDKVEEAARRAKKSVWEIAKMYEEEFFETMAALNVKKPDFVCRATEHIKEMVDFVKKIEKNGFAYKTSDGIYFDTSKLADYGILAHVSLDKLKEGARVEKNPEKKNPTDFALWKFSPKDKKRQMEWDSPWGVGFPGWHIECSAMSTKYLGQVFDIHTGGEDHINVHHTNEIAQSQGAYGKIPARFWFHNTFLMVDGKKMSKSLGNFYWLKDVKERKFSPMALRYLFLTAHYRSRLNFTWKALESAQQAYEKLKGLILGWQEGEGRKVFNQEYLEKIDKARAEFNRALASDLDIPKAVSVVWQVAKSNIPDPDKKDLIFEFDKVLRLNLASVSPIEIPERVKRVVEEREKLREREKWKEADKIRKAVEKKGFVLEDTTGGTVVKKA